MKIFLSWSGNESKQLAAIFKEWLPNVLQFVDPYMSAKDISLGERWNNSITGNLHESTFGLIFVTPSNINAPWINYEAGALSKTLDSKVVPILYNADVMILNEGPLKQFQSAKNLEKESIFSLLQSINNANNELKLDEQRLEKSFDMWWKTLEDLISEIVTDEASTSDREPSEKEMLNVIFSKVIEQEKYLKKSNVKRDEREEQFYISPIIFENLEKGMRVLEKCKEEISGGPNDYEFSGYIEDGLSALKESEIYLKRRVAYNDERINSKNKNKLQTLSLF